MFKQIISFLLLIFTTFTANITKFKISSYIFPNKTLQMQLDVVAPKAPGKYPTILYLTGLSGLAPYFMQSEVVESVAQNQFVFLTLSKLQSPLPQQMTKVLVKIVTWMNQNLQSYIDIQIPGVKADITDQLILMGHSAAAHVITQYLNDTCGNVKLQILLDGVDGVDPFGIKNDFITHPGEFLPYATPVLVLQTELDPVPITKFQPPCAADNMSNMRYYNAMSGPKWYLNVSKYGHVDFFNDQYRVVASTICQVCRRNCNFKEYRSLVVDIIVNFSHGILYKDMNKIKWIQQSQFNIPTTHLHDYQGYNVESGGFCSRIRNDESKKNLITQ